MKSLRLFSGILIFFGLVLGSVFVFIDHEDSITLSSFGGKRKKSKKKDNRLFEPSEIKAQIDRVEDEPSALFNDPNINQAWGLKKADAARAWSVSKGSREVIVAVIDTGADINHEDLAGNLWINKGETGRDANGVDRATNGIDDDHNGFIDDTHGWNFVSNNNDLKDNHGHGNHIAGIIGARAGNGKGISGIAPEVSLMILKYYDPKVPNTDNLKNTIAAIRYAVNMGAHIINYSGGGTEYSADEKAAVAEADRKGILFVAAAGNERSNSDQFKYYPADYGLSNIISVTAIDPGTQVLASSNYGVETVDIAAPGQNILSLLPNNSYGYMTGTSQATAFVTGAAALVMAHKQAYKAADVKKYILSTGDNIPDLALKTKTSRKLNLYKALTVLDQGVTANGVTVVNGNSREIQKSFKSDQTNRDATNIMVFGHSLRDAVNKIKADPQGTPKKERLGNKNSE